MKSGRLRVLGVAGPKPSPLLPGVKTLVDQGFAGLIVSNTYPVMAPAGTPQPVVEKIRAGLEHVMSDPAVRKRLESAGIDPAWEGDPKRVTEQLATDRARWRALAQRAGIHLGN